MQVTTIQGSGHDRRVGVSAPGVEGSGTWFGRLPASGDSVDVELDIRDEIRWDDIVLDPAPDGPVAGDGQLAVQGEVVGLGHDGVLMLHTLGGSVVLVETTGDVPVGALGKVALVTLRDVTIYPSEGRVAPLIVTLDGTRIEEEADIHLAFKAMLDLGPGYGNDAAALRARLGADTPRPLHVLWTDARRSEAALGADTYARYTSLFAEVRTGDVEGGHADPLTYEIRP